MATIHFIPALAKNISESTFKDQVEPMLKQWLEDPVHSVRMEVITYLVKLKKEVFNLDWLERLLDLKMEEFHKHIKFAVRIHTLFVISNVYNEVSEKFLNDRLYKQYMKKLADDPVANIRFNYAKTAEIIYKKLSNSNKMDCTETLKRLQEND